MCSVNKFGFDKDDLVDIIAMIIKTFLINILITLLNYTAIKLWGIAWVWLFSTALVYFMCCIIIGDWLIRDVIEYFIDMYTSTTLTKKEILCRNIWTGNVVYWTLTLLFWILQVALTLK